MPGVDANSNALNELFEALSAQAICEPIHLEGKIIIPVFKIGMGIGTRMKRTVANANKKDANEVDKREEGLAKLATGGTSGGGVGISPVAVLIIAKGSSGPDGVKVVSLSQPGESLFDIAGDLMEMIAFQKKMGERGREDMAAIRIE